METRSEWCPKHGNGEFFLADSDDTGESLHCPECFPELFAELTAIDAALEKKREAANAVVDSTTRLVDAVRAVVTKGKSAPVTSQMVLKHALALYDEAVELLESL